MQANPRSVCTKRVFRSEWTSHGSRIINRRRWRWTYRFVVCFGWRIWSGQVTTGLDVSARICVWLPPVRPPALISRRIFTCLALLRSFVYQTTKDLLSVLFRHSCVHAAVAKEIRGSTQRKKTFSDWGMHFLWERYRHLIYDLDKEQQFKHTSCGRWHCPPTSFRQNPNARTALTSPNFSTK